MFVSANRHYGRIVFLATLALSSSLAYQNCAEYGKLSASSSYASEGVEGDSPGPESSNQGPTKALNDNPIALLSAHELLASFQELTGVARFDRSVNGNKFDQIERTFNNGESMFGVSNSVDQITAPSLVMTTTLAGDFCSALIAKEAASPNAERLFFQGIDLQANAAVMSEALYRQSVITLSKRFWGREPDASEMETLIQPYVLSTASDFKTPATVNRTLLLMPCSAILSSFDSQTF